MKLIETMLHTGYRVPCWLPGSMLVTGHQFMVPPLVAGCGLLTGVGMMQHAAIVFVEIAVGTIPRAEIQRYHESCQFTTERIVNVIQTF